ncbi:hypothetical protein M3Y95_00341000 [Aphelenchoides besseyi]|nr:hypothetical protein M3Y95_00341000 [Aphelenchoides besseyi]
MSISENVGEMLEDEQLDKSEVQIDQSPADDQLVFEEEHQPTEGELSDQILTLTTDSSIVEERSNVEVQEINEATADDMDVFITEFAYSAFTSVFSLDGRYLIQWNSRQLQMTDMLYSQETCLNFDFSTATIAGEPLRADFKTYEFFAFDLESTTVFFHDTSSPRRYYIGIAKMDLKHSKYSIVSGETTRIPTVNWEFLRNKVRALRIVF